MCSLQVGLYVCITKLGFQATNLGNLRINEIDDEGILIMSCDHENVTRVAFTNHIVPMEVLRQEYVLVRQLNTSTSKLPRQIWPWT